MDDILYICKYKDEVSKSFLNGWAFGPLYLQKAKKYRIEIYYGKVAEFMK